jgi:RHS repeat-associated protein
VSALSDETGAVLRRISYGLWGEVRSNMPEPGMASLDSAEKYTGQRYDAETSLYYYGVRYYDPQLGRFMGADAVIASQYRTSALHPYTYVEGNPLNNVDPSGNFSTQVPSAGGRYGWNRPGRNTGPSVLDGLGSLWEDAFRRHFPNGLALQTSNPTAAKAPAESEQPYPFRYVYFPGPAESVDENSPHHPRNPAQESKFTGPFEDTLSAIRAVRNEMMMHPELMEPGELATEIVPDDAGKLWYRPLRSYNRLEEDGRVSTSWAYASEYGSVPVHSHPFHPGPSERDQAVVGAGAMGAIVSRGGRITLYTGSHQWPAE